MKVLNHAQARRYLQAEADHLLDESDRAALEQHLHTCAECRREAERLKTLESVLQTTFHARWDAIHPPTRSLVSAPAPQARGARVIKYPAWLPGLGLNLLLIILWLWLYRAILDYLGLIFTHQEFRTNQLMLLGVGLLIISQLRRGELQFRPEASPRWYLPGLALALGGSILYLLAERFLDINTLSATLFGLATYGFLGLWATPSRWVRGLPAALLLIGTLPFGQHLETFVGYPLRMATANMVSHSLNAAGFASINIDTILVMENGLSQVDSPCSGVKSLWTGLLFLLAATWLERHPINGRWLLIAALTGLLLAAANIARVGILVLVGQAVDWPKAAEMMHVPLGVLGFIAVCGLAAFGLSRDKRSAGAKHNAPPAAVENAAAQSALELSPRWSARPVLLVILFSMGWLYTPRIESAKAQAALTWRFPDQINVTPFPLSEGLYAWVTQDGADSAERWHFVWDDLSGSVLFLTSQTWRGQHRPERCFEVEGLSVDTTQTFLIGPDFPVRYLTLKGGPYQVAAVYWLQSENHLTEDYATRIWADLRPERETWVLVTVLFDSLPAPDEESAQALFQLLRLTIAQGLEGGQP